MRRLLAFLTVLVLLVSCKGDINPSGDEGKEKNNPNELTVTGNATDIGYSSARITAFANLPIELGAAEFGVICSTNPSPSNENGIMVEATELDANNMYSVKVDGLSSDTNYYFASFVRNGRVYQYGEIKTFHTLEVKAELKTQPATDVDKFVARLNGSLKVEGNADSLGTDVWFLYGKENTVEGLKTKGQSCGASLSEDGSFSSNLIGLSHSTSYYYMSCARVYDKEFVGSVLSFTTNESLAPSGATDLGLSVYWGATNIGASKPEGYGDYYAWGETATKSDYSWSTYKYGSGWEGPFSKYNTDESYGTVDNKTILEATDDVAHLKLGGNWRMPTNAEWTELREQCTWDWVTNFNSTGVTGVMVTATNGNSIFLPAAGSRYETNLDDVGSWGIYLSSSLNSRYPSCAWIVFFQASFYSVEVLSEDYARCGGYSVRPVSE